MLSWLYQHIFKPFAFAQDPEKVHERVTRFGEALGKRRVTREVMWRMFGFEHPRLERTVAGITFKNPVGLAAGFDKNARLIDLLPYVGFGFVECGSITAKPCQGNPRPRLWRLPECEALVVNYGLVNDGVDAVLERMRKSRVITLRMRGGAREGEDEVLRNFRIGISIAKTNCRETAEDEAGIADYFECFQKAHASGLADYLTINVSCPNAYGGEPFTTPEKFERLSERLREIAWRVPVFVKLPCDYSSGELDGMLEVALRYGYSGVILSNLTKERTKNPLIQRSDLSKVGKGGISGKPTFEKSNALIRRAKDYLSSVRDDTFVLIGCGGVFSGEDAKTKLDAGADLIQMITGMIYRGPQVVGEINRFLAHCE